ncbi:Uncharacterized protein DIS24_g2518 [Lasiodiplodia hormozganensis]|uniref:2-oxoadipate dioxygenase/decarboxylase n=1 Tax=Lasiodiplodia hormozganensis TaxID=869390 RepID=A0AA40D4J6_9PEZI|nr:Uncharacterized protein DIS24_g2518 [Lasiodiplodia hormozganensis]
MPTRDATTTSGPSSPSEFVNADNLRTKFALAMSAMYREEVPLYGDLVNIVRNVNESVDPIRASSGRLMLERHGAIRLGTPKELQTVRRIFAILGMHPFGYYDLSIAGLPTHATCFRPKDMSSLDRNPFRVFTTLLRPELLESEEARDLALSLLEKRKIFTDLLLELLDVAESQGGKLSAEQAEAFIAQALLTFSWRSVAAATIDQYNALKAEHPILADIACFQSAHINHLTPRTLDISAAHVAMREAGMAVKSRIEGPPRRRCPILLRQTSFLALEETVNFMISEDTQAATNDLPPQSYLVKASHKARFGEIEERGAAVTVKGRQLYDRLLSEAMTNTTGVGPVDVDTIMEETFMQYPDDWTELRKQGLIYCHFRCTKKAVLKPTKRNDTESLLEQLIAGNIIEPSPITYEDFLPFSAAGIFRSNLQPQAKGLAIADMNRSSADLEGFEEAMQGALLDVDAWYSQAQLQSLEDVARELGLSIGDLL